MTTRGWRHDLFSHLIPEWGDHCLVWGPGAVITATIIIENDYKSWDTTIIVVSLGTEIVNVEVQLRLQRGSARL